MARLEVAYYEGGRITPNIMSVDAGWWVSFMWDFGDLAAYELEIMSPLDMWGPYPTKDDAVKAGVGECNRLGCETCTVEVLRG